MYLSTVLHTFTQRALFFINTTHTLLSLLTFTTTNHQPPPRATVIITRRRRINFPRFYTLCMAVSFLGREVSDLCLGKPPLRSLSAAATVADALGVLKSSDESFVSVWRCEEENDEVWRCVGKVCMVDVICYLCKEENLLAPSSALNEPLSKILPKDPSIVVHLQPSSRCKKLLIL